MHLPSVVKPTVVLTQNDIDVEEQKALKRPVSVVNADKQQLY